MKQHNKVQNLPEYVHLKDVHGESRESRPQIRPPARFQPDAASHVDRSNVPAIRRPQGDPVGCTC